MKSFLSPDICFELQQLGVIKEAEYYYDLDNKSVELLILKANKDVVTSNAKESGHDYLPAYNSQELNEMLLTDITAKISILKNIMENGKTGWRVEYTARPFGLSQALTMENEMEAKARLLIHLLNNRIIDVKNIK